MRGGARVLVIAHDERIRRSLEWSLSAGGYAVHAERCGSHGLGVLALTSPDLVVMDLALRGDGCPEGARADGFHVLEAIHARDPDVPVIATTEHDNPEERVRALRLGADKYLTFPMTAPELLAHVEAVLRRVARIRTPQSSPAQPAPDAAYDGDEPGGLVRFDDVEVDLDARTVRRAGRPVELRPREAELLFALARQRGRVVGRRELLRDVWHYAEGARSRTVDSHMAELRRKLEPDPARPRYLVTVHGRGYTLRDARQGHSAA